MTSKPKKRASYHHGDLRRALLKAALELIRERGVEALSIRAVARRAGVSHMAPYHHFDDRAALVAAVAEEGFVLLRAAMRERMETASDPPSQLQASGIAYVRFAVKHAAHFRVMFSAELADKSAFPALEAASAETYGVLADAVVRCQDAGLIRAADPEVLSDTAWSLVHGLSMLLIDGHLCHEGGSIAVEPLARAVTSTLWDGLGIRSERA